MHGEAPSQLSFVSLIHVGTLAAADRPIRATKRRCDEALRKMSGRFDEIHGLGPARGLGEAMGDEALPLPEPGEAKRKRALAPEALAFLAGEWS